MSSPSPNTATAEDYRNAFLALEPQMSETRRKLLSSHYHFYDHQGTMTQIAKAMGWPSYRNGNAHYGRLAKLVVGASVRRRKPERALPIRGARGAR